MSVTGVCRYFGYSRQAYYQRIKEACRVEVGKDMILKMVNKIRRFNPKMGGKKLYHLLKEDIHQIDESMGRDKFFDLLREKGLLVSRNRKYATTTQSLNRFYKYKDLYNNRMWMAPHQAWVSDITYLRVGETFRYLFLITDAYSRKIVGWCFAGTLETKWAIRALRMALKQCPSPKGLIHHSDRGFQYCSRIYTTMLKKAGARPSMGQAGNCYDNAMAERINGILKTEYGLDEAFKIVKDASKAIKQAIKSYNEQRPHWSLGLKIPEEIHCAA